MISIHKYNGIALVTKSMLNGILKILGELLC